MRGKKGSRYILFVSQISMGTFIFSVVFCKTFSNEFTLIVLTKRLPSKQKEFLQLIALKTLKTQYMFSNKSSVSLGAGTENVNKTKQRHNKNTKTRRHKGRVLHGELSKL